MMATAISIHALREESDYVKVKFFLRLRNFNPRPPRGERLGCPVVDAVVCVFQSTPSARRATNAPHTALTRLTISIHALREESDVEVLADLEPED